MSELVALGVSHKTAPVALRERLAFTDSQAREFAQRATATPEVREAVVISTCNRTEVYLVVGDPVRAEADVLGLLARRAEIRLTELAEVIYSPRNCDAARQLYRVTAGLESMIVGEAEVQGQVRRAHEAAMRAGCTGPLSNRLFAAALSTGKRVRSEADIVLSSTSSPHAIVGREELEMVMHERAQRPLLAIDIAVPRDIDPACAEIEGVTLYDIDDLQAVIARNLEGRAGEVPRAEAIVEEE